MAPIPGRHCRTSYFESHHIAIVKWSGKKLDIEVDPSESAETLKTQLYSMTGVAPERQKLLSKGKMITVGICDFGNMDAHI